MTTLLRTECLGQFDWAARRVTGRLAGLSDPEWAWTPTNDPDISIKWRMNHLIDGFTQSRCRTWLGLQETPATFHVTDAATAVSALQTVLEWFRDDAAGLSDVEWAAPIGAVAGSFADSLRAAFVLQMTDDLIHHGVEAALLRDLWAHRET